MRIAPNIVRALAACAVGWLAAAGAGAAQVHVAEQIRMRVEELLFTGQLQFDGAIFSDRAALTEFYTHREFAPAWTPRAATAWIDWVASIDTEGLRPEDYFLGALQRAQRLASVADRDLLLTASLLRAADDLRFGKLDPASLDATWHLERGAADAWDAAAVAAAAIASESPGSFLAALLPRPRLYYDLQAALRRYREIAAAGGWPPMAPGETLREGDLDARVATLRQRLAITGDYQSSSTAPQAALFDPQLERAVRLFQQRHGLDVDGFVGPKSLAALNVPVEARIDQIRLNLERGRWVFDNLAPRFVVVNIASFEVFLVEHDVPVWSARAVVGRYYRQTPTFRGELQYLVLNPTWTVPPTILREDIVPRAKTEPDYLREMGIDVLTRDGAPVDPSALDWSRLTPRNFPYVLEQRAGPQNVLGQVKFIFPNPFFVFLHDTPQKTLFDAAQRTFSSGCIRVEDAVTLAELVLDDPRWTRARLEAEIATGRTHTVHLSTPLPVLVLYWTASVDAHGHVRFLPDVYGRDPRVLAALDAPAS